MEYLQWYNHKKNQVSSYVIKFFFLFNSRKVLYEVLSKVDITEGIVLKSLNAKHMP